MNFEECKNDVLFTALGGVGEIGMNMYLYGYNGKWLMVDIGIGIADDVAPGVDILLPDPAFIAERNKDLVGIVITHAHEDHIGAVSSLWPQLKCPIYVSPFAREMLESRLDENGLLGRIDLITLEPDTGAEIGPFIVESISVNHSTPEATALVIRTGAGRILHTGDWKFDSNPLIEDKANFDALKKLGDEGGVLAVVGDSTNIFTEGHSVSESVVLEALEGLIGKFNRRIFVTCFSSNVARVESITKAAQKNGRQVCLIGRSLWRVDGAARMAGYFKDLPEFLSEEEALQMPADKVLFICTGSQGEKRSSLYMMANNEHRHIKLGQGDVVIFSSRIIPGNETEISLVQNRLSILGAEVITSNNYPKIHVSGHPAREDIREMYAMVKPKFVIPVHGEPFHLEEHAKYARELGVEKALEIRDGDVVRISGNACEVVGEVPTGILAIDGKRIIRLDSEILKKRKKIIYSGSLVITVVVDKDAKVVGEPQVSSIGLFDDASNEIIVIKKKTKEVISALEDIERGNDFGIKEKIRMAVRKYVLEVQGNKPLTEIHLVRI